MKFWNLCVDKQGRYFLIDRLSDASPDLRAVDIVDDHYDSPATAFEDWYRRRFNSYCVTLFVSAHEQSTGIWKVEVGAS